MKLKYGETSIPFDFENDPEVYQIKEPAKTIDQGLLKQRLTEALNQLQPDLRSPAIVVGDKTRLCGYPEYLPFVLNTLEEFGAPKDQLRIYIAYGTHLPQSDLESLESYGAVFKNYHFIQHDCTDSKLFENLGQTTRGTTGFLRRDIAEASFLLTFGAVAHHYFAGYGGGRKLVFPGLGYKPAIYQNHSLFLDAEAQCLAKGCQAGMIEGNPLAEDLAEVEKFRPADLAIHGILDSQGTVCDLLVGSGTGFFREVCSKYGKYCEIKTEQQYDLVIASCGGFPKDINFIQSHKAVHNAAFFVKDGGQLIVLAECRDGVGSKTFLPWLEMGGYRPAFKQLVQNYEGNGGTALAMMEKLKRIRISLMTSIDPDTSKAIGFENVTQDQVQSIINDSITPIAVIPNASLLVKMNIRA